MPATKQRAKENTAPRAKENTAPGSNESQSPGAEKKQIPLRLSGRLYAEIAAWAADDFRSVNGQIEYLLTQCVEKRKGR